MPNATQPGSDGAGVQTRWRGPRAHAPASMRCLGQERPRPSRQNLLSGSCSPETQRGRVTLLKVAQLGTDSTHTGGWDARPEFLAPVGSHGGVAAGKFHPHRSFSSFKKPAVEVQGCSPTLLRQGLRAAGAGPVCPPPGLSLLGWIVPTGHWPERLSLSLTASATPPLPAAPQRCHGNRMGISKASPSIIWASDLGQACNEGTVC